MWLHPEIRTLADVPGYWAQRTPTKAALRSGASELTYADLEHRINQTAHAIIAAGGAHGDRVCFIAKNVPEFWIAWFAASKAGCAFVPLNWRCTTHELAELLTDAEPVLTFADREYADAIAQAHRSAGIDSTTVVFESEADAGPGLAEWAGQGTSSPPDVRVVGEDIALIAYTSGTTGRPKGVMIRHEAFDLFHLSDDLEPTINWSSDDVNLMVMPNFHLAGSWVSLPTLYHGGTVAIIRAFEPSAVLEAIEEHRPTTLCLVPTAIQALVSHPSAATTDLSSLRTLIYAGSPISAQTMDAAVEAMGCELRQFYGTSETYIITILRPEDHVRTDIDVRASCGAPVPLVSVRIVDESGEDLPDGEVGQVLVRSPMVMAGYHRQPKETARVLRNGWYWTGDLGYRTDTGHHFLVDRAKDMVVTGGENVYSIEVERALQKHPEVAMVAVVGQPDEQWGEAVTAYVVPAAGAETDPEAFGAELIAHCRELIAAYKVPKRIHVKQSLPMTPMGKVRKVDLRRQIDNDNTEEGTR